LAGLLQESETLAGYVQIILQGRPLLTDMLPFFAESPGPALRAIPALRQLTPENYGEL
jgi:hypothetical protein